jgi:probable addiction module antidote protein
MKKQQSKFRSYDAAEYLENEEVIAQYLSEVFETGTDAEIKTALADVARAGNMTEIAKKMNVSRPSLYKSLSSDTRTEFDTIRSFLHAIGVSMVIVPRHGASSNSGK